MELHLHLNVFMGGMFLSDGLRLEGRMGSRAETINAVVFLSALRMLSNRTGNPA